MKQPPPVPTYFVKTLRELLFKAVERYSYRVALKTKTQGLYHPLTYRELGERVETMAVGLFQLGLQKGDRVAVLSENRTEWAVAYLAVTTSGLVVVPVDKDLKREEIEHILNFSEAKVLICSGHYASMLKQAKKLPSLRKTVAMEVESSGADLSFLQVSQQGQNALSAGDRTFQEIEVDPDDLAAIIFTSGTTGRSKAVMLTHGNIAADIVATSRYVSLQDGVLLSVLPLHHTYECTGGFLLALYQGCTVWHAENLRRIPENLQESRATVMLGVPQLFEAMYRKIQSGIREKGELKVRLAKGIATLLERFFGLNIRRALFKSLHDRFGGALRLFISGGAAADPAIAKGFRDLGIDFIQGYGMTEASPIIAVNRINAFRDAAVGLPLPGLEVKIIDSEIVVRGPTVMKGYYRNEAATAETLRQGWLYTGDLGYFDEDGFLYINGRKKSVIVTPNGKNIYPEELEAGLNESPYILESLVWGGVEAELSRVEVQAIIVPLTETFDTEFGPNQYDEVKIEEVIAAEVKRCCQKLANYKRIRKFTLRDKEFEKTTTRKIKRYLYTLKPR